MSVELRKAWRDSATHLLFEPAEFLETLAALPPRPEVHALLSHWAWPRTLAGPGRS